MYTNYTNIQSTIHSEPGTTHLGRVLKLANRQAWAVSDFLAPLQVTALLTQDCSRTHCTAQVLLNPEQELCSWVLAGWKCRAPSEPWSCMSVLWSLLHPLSRIPHTRGTPGSLGLAPRIPLHHQSYWQCHNQSLLHKEVHHQTPGCCYCTFCRKITRETGCHQRRGCSQGEEQATGKCFFWVQPWLCNKGWGGTKQAQVCLCVCLTNESDKMKSGTHWPLRSKALLFPSLLLLLLRQKQSALHTDNTILALRHLQRLQKLKYSREEGIQFPEGCWFNHHPPPCSSTFSVRPN